MPTTTRWREPLWRERLGSSRLGAGCLLATAGRRRHLDPSRRVVAVSHRTNEDAGVEQRLGWAQQEEGVSRSRSSTAVWAATVIPWAYTGLKAQALSPTTMKPSGRRLNLS